MVLNKFHDLTQGCKYGHCFQLKLKWNEDKTGCKEADQEAVSIIQVESGSALVQGGSRRGDEQSQVQVTLLRSPVGFSDDQEMECERGQQRG